MAKRQKKFERDTSGDWLNTYADMVTLLLTFFVMLYASSNPDEVKWQYIMQAFQSRGKFINSVVDQQQNNFMVQGDGNAEASPDPAAGDDKASLQTFDQLYQFLSKYIEDNNLQSSVSVEAGVAHINIRFDSAVFFDGDSAVLKDSGKQVLNGIIPAIRMLQEAIARITVNGHTAKGLSAVNDWDLSADRACSVVKYMEFQGVVKDNDKYRVGGIGPAEPIAPNDTEENKAKNRRVEMILLKSDVDLTDPEILMDYLKYGFGIDFTEIDNNKNTPDDNTPKLPSDSAQAIIDNINALYPDISGNSGDLIGPVVPGDYESFKYTVSEEAGDDNGAAAETS